MAAELNKRKQIQSFKTKRSTFLTSRLNHLRHARRHQTCWCSDFKSCVDLKSANLCTASQFESPEAVIITEQI